MVEEDEVRAAKKLNILSFVWRVPGFSYVELCILWYAGFVKSSSSLIPEEKAVWLA